jgi:hypothetical protein
VLDGDGAGVEEHQHNHKPKPGGRLGKKNKFVKKNFVFFKRAFCFALGHF